MVWRNKKNSASKFNYYPIDNKSHLSLPCFNFQKGDLGFYWPIFLFARNSHDFLKVIHGKSLPHKIFEYVHWQWNILRFNYKVISKSISINKHGKESLLFNSKFYIFWAIKFGEKERENNDLFQYNSERFFSNKILEW